jgi:hypothetical protein
MRQAADSYVVTGRFLPCIFNLEDINTVTAEKETPVSSLFPMDLNVSVQRDEECAACFLSVFIGVSSFIRVSADGSVKYT